MADPYSQKGYIKLRTIGRGAFGEAVLVASQKTGIKLICKEVNSNLVTSKQMSRAQQEASLLSKLAHPNIVAYFESFEKSGNLYIVMEYANGGDLHATLQSYRKRRTLVNEKQIGSWFAQLCLAVSYLHQQKILHRDLKSSNVFLTRNGMVKLGDFGLATVLNHSLAMAHTVCGTVAYFSPELCQGSPYNSKSDVWALGCILYESAALRTPFSGDKVATVMSKILEGNLDPISPTYSMELWRLICSLLVQNPKLRPGIAAVLENPFTKSSLASCQAQAQEILMQIQEKRKKLEEKGMELPTPPLLYPEPLSQEGPIWTQAPTPQNQQFTSSNSRLRRSDIRNMLSSPPPEYSGQLPSDLSLDMPEFSLPPGMAPPPLANRNDSAGRLRQQAAAAGNGSRPTSPGTILPPITTSSAPTLTSLQITYAPYSMPSQSAVSLGTSLPHITFTMNNSTVRPPKPLPPHANGNVDESVFEYELTALVQQEEAQKSLLSHLSVRMANPLPPEIDEEFGDTDQYEVKSPLSVLLEAGIAKAEHSVNKTKSIDSVAIQQYPDIMNHPKQMSDLTVK